MDDRICEVSDCGRVLHTRALCRTHYGRLQRHGDVQAEKPVAERVRRSQDAGRKSLAAPLKALPDGNYECQGCGEPKPLESFSARSDSPNSRRKKCVDCRRIYAKAWRTKHAALCREYSARDSDEKRERNARRHLLRRSVLLSRPLDADISRSALREIDGDECCYCGITMTFERAPARSRPRNLATVEHVIPVARGGAHVWDNCALACWACNVSKGARESSRFQLRPGHRLTQSVGGGF